MKSFIHWLTALAIIFTVAACNDNAGVGGSLAEESVVIVVDSNFTVSATDIRNDVVQSRTLSQLIGDIVAPGYGSIHSDFVGQMMPSLQLDTVKPENIDSIKLFIQMNRGNFVGDSLVPMGLEVYRLTKDLPYPIYSDFDPDGYYDPNSPLASGVYTASTMNEPDSIKKLSVIYKALDLPLSLGRELMKAYADNPAAFANPETFSSQIFKGLYIKSNYGSGRISDFSTTSIRVYFHRNVYNTDSARYELKKYVGDYFAATPEVVVNNNIHYTPAPELAAMVNSDRPVLAAPAGYEAQLRFPLPEILASYNRYSTMSRVLNTLTFQLPVEKIDNKYEIAPPPYVLLVLKSKKAEFFATNSLCDNVTSFYAAYDASTSSYSFTGLRQYLLEMLKKDNITEDDYTFIVTPVQVNTESAGSNYYGMASTVVSSIVPYVSKPAMCRIIPSDAKIKLTFSAGNNKI
ncbi:MAG: DUF4270 domain-containing protein [Muribaculaceae bacterium]|nr:DUF4270 domain-containing protein [Muribaculaceae bacterium]